MSESSYKTLKLWEIHNFISMNVSKFVKLMTILFGEQKSEYSIHPKSKGRSPKAEGVHVTTITKFSSNLLNHIWFENPDNFYQCNMLLCIQDL